MEVLLMSPDSGSRNSEQVNMRFVSPWFLFLRRGCLWQSGNGIAYTCAAAAVAVGCRRNRLSDYYEWSVGRVQIIRALFHTFGGVLNRDASSNRKCERWIHILKWSQILDKCICINLILYKILQTDQFLVVGPCRIDFRFLAS